MEENRSDTNADINDFPSSNQTEPSKFPTSCFSLEYVKERSQSEPVFSSNSKEVNSFDFSNNPRFKHVQFIEGKCSPKGRSSYIQGRRVKRQQSLGAESFIRYSAYKRGKLKVLSDGSKNIFNLLFLVQEYNFRLSAATFDSWKYEETIGRKQPDLSFLLTDIQRIYTFKEKEPKEFVFSLEIKTENNLQKEIKLAASSLKEMASWVIAIDGLVSNVKGNSFESYLYPITEKNRLLRVLYKDNYSGGIIKSSFEEEWIYEPDGTVSMVEDPEGYRIVYKWDGRHFIAQSDSMSYGAGEFSGVFFGWYLQEWMSFKNGTREKFLKYFYDPIEGEYRPECEGLTAWKWTRHFLASKLNNGEWMIEGEVPEPVVMFLQLIRYSRYGYELSDVNLRRRAVVSLEDVTAKKKKSSSHNTLVIFGAILIVAISCYMYIKWN